MFPASNSSPFCAISVTCLQMLDDILLTIFPLKFSSARSEYFVLIALCKKAKRMVMAASSMIRRIVAILLRLIQYAFRGFSCISLYITEKTNFSKGIIGIHVFADGESVYRFTKLPADW
jgi:hypothetical protein